MTMYKTLLAAIIVSLYAGLAMAEELSPIYAAQETSSAPVIDGILNDRCWEKAEKTSAFVSVGGKKAPLQTRGMLCRDNKALYVAVICAEPLMNKLQEQIKKEGVAPFAESIEIFIDGNHDHSSYLQFRVGIAGEKDSHRGGDQGFEIAPDLDAKWQAAASPGKDAWSVEAAIPFDCLEISPAPIALAGFNLNRTRALEYDGMYTCWSDTQGGFHSPPRFGHLVFTGYPGWLEESRGQQIDGVKKEIETLFKDYPESASSLKDTVVRLDNDRHEFFRKITATNIDNGTKCLEFFKEGETVANKYNDALSEIRYAIIKGKFK